MSFNLQNTFNIKKRFDFGLLLESEVRINADQIKGVNRNSSIKVIHSYFILLKL